ncbi:hypothetical protein [Streptomyces sp. NPDC059008]|uniref:hypothetical protein n=1 Tax=Streptomyces sp. NPDC059008 TaxID=3346693 RepID=UPI003680043C
MNLRYTTDRAVIRCDQCPGQPILPTHREETDSRRCVRCQGENRWLPQPHPEDHLCTVCRRECPSCQALTPNGERCRVCRGRCRTCAEPLPERPDYASGITHVEPEKRKDRHRKWTQTFFPRAWDWDQCDACQNAARASNPLRVVLAGLPDKLVLACGGGVPPTVVDMIYDELQRHTPAQLAARVERRWWRSWSSRPLSREAEGNREGYRPDDVAAWLLAPTPCGGQCEDGWHLADRPDRDDEPCKVCRGGRLLVPQREADENSYGEEHGPSSAADRTPSEAVAYRPPMGECIGKNGACGLPVLPPHTQCPTCLDWPWCVCRRRRYNPEAATACPSCAPRWEGARIPSARLPGAADVFSEASAEGR